MSLSQFMQALTALPQIVEKVKKMDEEEKTHFVEQLGLEGEEKGAAHNIITCFQEGRPLNQEEQAKAQQFLEKALQMNDLDLTTLLNMKVDKK